MFHNEEYALMSIRPHAMLDLMMTAYASQDASELLSYFSYNAKIYKHPSQLFLSGSNEIFDCLKDVFAKYPDNKAEVMYRMINGGTVTDMIRIIPFPSRPSFDAVVIYEIKQELIVRIDIMK